MDKQIFADTNIPYALMADKKKNSKIFLIYLIIAILCAIAAVVIKNWGLIGSAVILALLCLKANKKARELDLRAQDLKECNISLSDKWMSVQQVSEDGRYETINIRYDEVSSVVEQHKRPGVPMFYVNVENTDGEDRESQFFIDGIEQSKWSCVEIDGRNYDVSEFRRFYLDFISMLRPVSVVVKTDEQTSWFKKESKAGTVLAIALAIIIPVAYYMVTQYLL